jgi:hypothetical protein
MLISHNRARDRTTGEPAGQLAAGELEVEIEIERIQSGHSNPTEELNSDAAATLEAAGRLTRVKPDAARPTAPGRVRVA